MPLSAGTRLGPYEILSVLGAGGMGEVYRARDTKLGRDVALKILPDSFTHDPERVARFRREGQVLASLNHPHIGAIYGLEEANGTQFLVLELVDGESLAERIKRGRLPLDEALGIAKQIAEALEAAHEKGIIHRDLKPANIALARDGSVKVLDFGLAKATEAASGVAMDAANSPTLTSPAMMTGVGLILGTAAYMSPEQAKGHPADKRSDVWAFGCVLCEMLIGRHTFEGEDVSDTLAAVLRSQPDLNELPSEVPPAIRRLIRRCLEKDRRQRVADMSAALFVIDEPTIGGEPVDALSPSAAPQRPAWRRAIPFLATVIVTAVLVGGVAWSLRPSTTSPSLTRFTLTLPEGQQFTNSGRQVIAISPDGTQIVYVANQRLYLRPISELEARPITGAESEGGVLNPAFSPDGRFLVFWSAADETLKTIAVTGGSVVTICPADRPYGVRWEQGSILAGQGSKGILRVSASGGKPDFFVSVKAEEAAYGPELLPDGQTVLFTLATGTTADKWDRAQVVAQSLKTGERHVIIDGASDAHYLPTGHLVYAQGGLLFATPFDPGRLSTSGERQPIVEGIRRSSGGQTGVAQFSVSKTGSLVYVPGPISGSSSQGDVALMDRRGVIEKLPIPPAAYDVPRVSPDGKQVALGIDDGKGANIWIYDLSRASSIRQLTFGGQNRFPVWTADGQRVAFQSDREGDFGIFWQRADGTDAAQRLTQPERGVSHIPESWSRTEDRFLFSASMGSRTSLWTFAVPDRKAEPFSQVGSRFPLSAVFSPDGRWVAYSTFNSDTAGIFVEPFPSTGAKYRITRVGALHPQWSPNGKELFFQTGGLFAVTVTTGRGVEFSSPVQIPGPFQTPGPTAARGYDIMPDGQRLIGIVSSGQGQAGLAAQIQVVLNWFDEVKARVATK